MPELKLPILDIDLKAAAELPRVADMRTRGETDGDRLFGAALDDVIRRSVRYVLAVMLDPRASADHERLNLAVDLRQVDATFRYAAAREIEIESNYLYPHLADREKPDDVIDAVLCGDRARDGKAAAFILTWIVMRHQNGAAPPRAGIGNATKAFGETMRHATGSSVENIRKSVWPTFRPTAHLWAGFYAMLHRNIDVLDAAGFSLFCGTAAWFLEEGCRIIPKGRKKSVGPLLSLNDAWTVPEPLLARGERGEILNRVCYQRSSTV